MWKWVDFQAQISAMKMLTFFGRKSVSRFFFSRSTPSSFLGQCILLSLATCKID